MNLAPQHHEARRTLSTILQQLGRAEEALQTLSQGEFNDVTKLRIFGVTLNDATILWDQAKDFVITVQASKYIGVSLLVRTDNEVLRTGGLVIGTFPPGLIIGTNALALASLSVHRSGLCPSLVIRTVYR